MPPAVKPTIEQLEARLLPDATSVLASLQDASIRTLAQKDFARDGMLNRTDMIGIFREVVKEGKKINATELGDLATLVNNSTVLKMPDYVGNLAGKIIGFDPANKHFHGKV